MNLIRKVGASYIPREGVSVCLWAPKCKSVAIEWVGQHALYPLQPDEDGYFKGYFSEARPGDRYWFHLDGEKRIADPASRYQPEGIDGPSEIVEEEYKWRNGEWHGMPFGQWVIYEIHTGTFSAAGDFEGIIQDLPRLKELGITAIELMPVGQFSGKKNWGYDSVFKYAVQNSYGGPKKLKKLVDSCHGHGMAIILDVVYNHFGPEGGTHKECGYYTVNKYQTPWGDSVNLDSKHNHHVRSYLLQNAWQWLDEYRFDGLRLDAVQMLFDNSAIPFLHQLHDLKVEIEKRREVPLALIAEIDTNDCRVLWPIEKNGFGMEAHWADDFHHCLHATLTDEKQGYYADYGGIEQLSRIYERGVAFEGNYSPYRKKPHGRSYEEIKPSALIVESQNHDQVGNRLKAERLIALVGEEKARLAAAAVLSSPFTPHLFMGEEFGCRQPFHYFVDYKSGKLIDKTHEARKEEWKSFGWKEEPPDPGSDEIYEACILTNKPDLADEMSRYYQQLIAFSKEIRSLGRPIVRCDLPKQYITLQYGDSMHVLLSFNEERFLYGPSEGYVCVFTSFETKRETGFQIEPYGVAVWKKSI